MHYNILIADDFDVNRNIIKGILRSRIENVNFFEADNGNQVMDILTEAEIDLIILDLVMPEMDGFQVLKACENHKHLSEIPVIVNSSLEDMDSLKKALESGALDYFTKPLTHNEMTITLPLKVKNALRYYDQKKLLVRYNNQMNREHEYAKLFQTSLMTKSQISDTAEMYGRYLPSNRIGGDFYEFLQVDDKQWFIIADVCGHGVVAAMLSSMIKVVFNHYVQTFSSPQEVMENLNMTFCNMLGEKNVLYFSAFVGMIEGDRLYYANAGHFYPMVINTSDGSLRKLEQKGLFIGILAETSYHNSVDVIRPGDCIVAYTDGLFDAGPHQDLDWEKVYENSLGFAFLLKDHPEMFIDALIKSVNVNTPESYWDDISVMVIKITSTSLN